jgi:hypothetical protein
MARRVISYLPDGELHVVWYDRREREGTVVLVVDRRPPALTDQYFRRQIPVWNALGIAKGLRVYPGAAE